ncbi:hypothetical protein ACJ41O_008827 [Fusarium nematophilum]
MNRLFRRADVPRRNTDEEQRNMQYHTPRGNLPAQMVDQQVREITDFSNLNPTLYPKEYRNTEPNGPPFQPFEKRDAGGERTFYEVPVNSRIELPKRPARLQVIERRERNVHPNDRARIVDTRVNDPGVFRGIVKADPNTGEPRGLAGVIYHPEGNPRGFDRAPMEPLDRDGRQCLRRCAEDGLGHRVTTWPPRDEDASDLTTYEDRYAQVRRPRNPPQPRA